MQHILIQRILTKHEEASVRSMAAQKNVLVLAEPELSDEYEFAEPLQKLNEGEKKEINYNALKAILEFGDYMIGDQPISKHLNYHGASLWYYHKFRIYFLIRNQEYKIAEIEKNAQGASSVRIYLEKTELDADRLSIQACKLVLGEKDGRQRLSWRSVLGYGFSVLCRFVISFLSSSSKFKDKHYVCIDTTGQYRDILSLNGSTTIFENAYLGYLYQKYGDEFGFIDQLLIPKFKGIDRFRLDKKVLKNHNHRARLFGEAIIGSVVLSISGLRELSRIKRYLNEIYQYLEANLLPDNRAIQILSEFKKLNSTSIFYLFKFFAYSRFFRKNNFKSILTTDENSPNFKIILDAARKHGIRTVGYQHGSIHELHPAYIYSKTDIRYNPIPDFTITWGKKWKKLLLEKGNYPVGRVGVAGQIRTDVISTLEQNGRINRRNILDKAEDRRIVLFATQPQRDPSLRCRAAEDVVKACVNLNNVQLVFKLHPREYDPQFYEEIAQSYGLKDYVISKEEELYILLHLSDVVITCFSTVGSEALYFQKPLVILDHLRQDILHYHRDGVAWQATNADELNSIINDILEGKLTIDRQKLENYLVDSTFAIDGKVAERVWNYLNKGS